MLGALHRNTLWLTTATVVYTGCQWVTIVFLSRFTSVTILGYYALAVALVMPLIAFTNLQLRYVLCGDARRDFSFADYFSVRVATVVLAVSGAAIWAAGYRPEIFLVVVALAISRAGDALSDIVYGALQMEGRIDRIALSLMLQGPVQLIVFAVTMVLMRSLLLAVLAAAIVSFAVFFFYDLRSLRLVLPHERANLWPHVAGMLRLRRRGWQSARTLMWLGAPMGVVMGLNSLIGNVPRYFLASDHGEALVGIFSALFYLTLPGGLVVTASCDSACAQIAKWAADGDFRRVWKMIAVLSAVALLIGFAGWLLTVSVGGLILSIFYGRAYAPYTTSLNWLMAGAGFMYISTVFGYAVTALREFRLQVPFRLVHLALVYVICARWVRAEALLGAAKTMFASSAFFALAMAVLLIVVVRKRFVGRSPVVPPSVFPAEANAVTEMPLQ